MNDLPELIFVVAVSQLIVNQFQVSNVELSFRLSVQKGEVGSPSLFVEWVSLIYLSITILTVSSFTKPSKSRALPPVPS